METGLGSVRGSVWLLCGIAVLAWMSVLVGSAEAHRQATARESKGMWRTLEREAHIEGCIERRGQISTAPTPRRKFGAVIIADSHCGNGQFVLAKKRGGSGAWRIRGAGSDWGDPDRCAEDLRRIPRRVLEDFFGNGYCAEQRGLS